MVPFEFWGTAQWLLLPRRFRIRKHVKVNGGRSR
jgi:hypothetical protein